jgi:hypothetical protein
MGSFSRTPSTAAMIGSTPRPATVLDAAEADGVVLPDARPPAIHSARSVTLDDAMSVARDAMRGSHDRPPNRLLKRDPTARTN